MLGRIKSWIWLLLYALALPVFAILYVVVSPDGFYFPTARFEPSTGRYYEQLISSLTSDLNRDAIPPDSAARVAMDGWEPEIGKAQVDNIVLPEGQLVGSRLHHRDGIPLELHFRVPIRKRSVGMGFVSCVGTLQVSRDGLLLSRKFARGVPSFLRPESVLVFTMLPTRLDGASITLLREGLEMPLISKRIQGNLVRQIMVGGDATTPAMTISPSSRGLLYRYMRALLGFPSDQMDNLWRMLYLSAVTLTTLGYGDIVPLTNTSRGLTALEACLGVLLVGLFLNSLAHGIRHDAVNARQPTP